jgi:hypothetical protein
VDLAADPVILSTRSPFVISKTYFHLKQLSLTRDTRWQQIVPPSFHDDTANGQSEITRKPSPYTFPFFKKQQRGKKIPWRLFCSSTNLSLTADNNSKQRH